MRTTAFQDATPGPVEVLVYKEADHLFVQALIDQARAALGPDAANDDIAREVQRQVEAARSDPGSPLHQTLQAEGERCLSAEVGDVFESIDPETGLPYFGVCGRRSDDGQRLWAKLEDWTYDDLALNIKDRWRRIPRDVALVKRLQDYGIARFGKAPPLPVEDAAAIRSLLQRMPTNHVRPIGEELRQLGFDTGQAALLDPGRTFPGVTGFLCAREHDDERHFCAVIGCPSITYVIEIGSEARLQRFREQLAILFDHAARRQLGQYLQTQSHGPGGSASLLA